MTRDEWTQLAVAVQGIWQDSAPADTNVKLTALSEQLEASPVRVADVVTKEFSGLVSVSQQQTPVAHDVEQIAGQRAAEQREVSAREVENVRPGKTTQTTATEQS